MPTLRRIRLQANITKRDLANMSGINYKTVLRADEGLPVTERTFVRILTALNEHLGTQYTLADLVDDEKTN